MVSVPLPPTTDPRPESTYADPLHAALLNAGIQVALSPWPEAPDGGPWRRLVRVSCAPYVGMDDIEALATALQSALVAA